MADAAPGPSAVAHPRDRRRAGVLAARQRLRLSGRMSVRRPPPVVSLPMAALHLGALSALAVAEPLFDLIQKNPDFLVARALIGWQVVGLGLVLVLVPPLLAAAIEALVGAVSRPLRAVLHLFFIAL